MSKPKVAFYWCASCGGCEESVVDLAEDILDVVAAVDFVFFPVAMDFKRSDVEAMEDGEIAVCFINGAIRSSEQQEMVHLLRRKSQIVIAYGSCSQLGGIPGLANLHSLEDILQYNYHDSPSTVNPDGVRPQHETKVPEAGGTEVELPTLDREVKSLDQVIDVEYYIPGCAPPTSLLKGAVEAVLSGNLPPKGTVLAPDMALCDECPRIGSKPQDLAITEFKRPVEVQIDPETCLLAQGLLCLGSATRSGCGHVCINGNMPCTGCLGPISRIRDHGAAAMSAIASLIGTNSDEEMDDIIEHVVDPVGTFYRYGLPQSFLFARTGITSSNGNGDA